MEERRDLHRRRKSSGLQGWRVKDPGAGAEVRSFSLPSPSARPHLRRLVLGSPRGNNCSPPGRPPHSSPPPGVAEPSPGGGSRRPQHPVPRLLSGYLGGRLQRWRLAAVSTLVPGGLRLRPPRCHPPRPRLWAVAAAEAAGNLRGAGCGSRGPSLLFHKPGPSQEQCRT